MDLGKFTTSDRLKVGGAAAFFVFSLFTWVKVSAGGFGSSGGNAFDFFWTGVVPWLLIVGVGVVSVLLAIGTIKPGTTPWPLILLGASGLAALLVVIRLLFNPIKGADAIEATGIVEISRGFGLYLSTIAALAVAAGAAMAFKESGGDLNDLTDVDKLKVAFNQGGSTPPPPPAPPGSMPPPPPPMPQ